MDTNSRTMISRALALAPVEHEPVGKMSLGKLRQEIVGFDEVGPHHEPIVVAVGVIHPEHGVGLVRWAHPARG